MQNRSYPNSVGRHQGTEGWEFVLRWDLAGNAQRVADEAVALLTAKPCPAGVTDIILLANGQSVSFDGPCVLAYDGEREREVRAGGTACVRVERTGPPVVDVDATLLYAANHQLFDVATPDPATPHLAPTEATHGH